MRKGFDRGKIESHYFLYNLQIFFPGSPDFPFPGVGKSADGLNLISRGRSFHNLGAATEKAQSP